MASEEDESTLARVERERDFYRTLLDLGKADNVGTFLSRALELVIDITRAINGYIELYDRDEIDDPARTPRWSLARGWSEDELARIRTNLSSGVIAEAIATGQTVCTSANDDPRFRDRHSVKEWRIEAVLCAPIGSGPPPAVIYLHEPPDHRPLPQQHQARAETPPHD